MAYLIPGSLQLHSDVRNLVVILLGFHSYRHVPHVHFMHCIYKHPIHAYSIPLMATAILQQDMKGSLQSFSSITRNGKIVSSEISGSELRVLDRNLKLERLKLIKPLNFWKFAMNLWEKLRKNCCWVICPKRLTAFHSAVQCCIII